MEGEVRLGIIVMGWLTEKKFPVRMYESIHKSDHLIWIDLDLRTPKNVHCALLAIVDSKTDPYVTLLDDRARPQEFYNPAHPEFFAQIESGITKAIKKYVDEGI